VKFFIRKESEMDD